MSAYRVVEEVAGSRKFDIGLQDRLREVGEQFAVVGLPAKNLLVLEEAAEHELQSSVEAAWPFRT